MRRGKSGASMSPAELDAARRPSWVKARRVQAKGSSAVAYVWENGRGQPCAMMYRGKQSKPAEHYRYASELHRAKRVEEFFASVAAWEGRAKEAKVPHKYQVGHILRTCWGYDQTNVEFFEVVRVPGPFSIVVRELADVDVGGGHGGDSSRSAPKIGHYVGEEKLCRAYGKDGVRIDDVRRAWLWDMKPASYSWGH